VSYSLFVNWFPHLIVGPVLHHAKMIPQLCLLRGHVKNYDNLASGLTLFAIGMGKKLLIADPLSLLASPVFNSVATGMEPSFFVAWYAAVAYSFQIYFDFSGYSDMALGLSRMFNVELPVNFASPYKAQSIIDFWCRWHISHSSFLRDYLYIPLGGSHNGEMRRYGNLMITMLLGGLWHGASWGFVIWGGLHGLFLVINHLWRAGPRMALQWFAHVKRSWIEAGVCILLALSASSISLSYGCVVLVLLLPCWLWRNFLAPEDDEARQWSAGVIRVMLTFIVVTLLWVFFRSTSLTAVNEMLQGMSGANGL
jgi:D-alanyl-lipoteichoic acid acyltransferase DltB (MBOAT superfamily)